MDLNKLMIFRDVVQAGSFTKAALQLKLPKSRVSRVIAGLEKDLGLQLIYRTTRQFQLTQAGQELYTRLNPLLNDLKNTLDVVTSEEDELSGLIKLTVPEDLGTELMGKICNEFMHAYPKVQIAMHASNQIVDLVKESIDVAIRISRSKDSSLIQKKIGSIELIAVMTPEVWQKYSPKKLEDLEKIPYLVFDARDLRTRSDKFTNKKEVKNLKLKPVFGSNNFFVLRSMALESAGFTFIPAFIAREAISSGKLIHVFKEWQFDLTPVQILIPHQKEVSKKVRKFIDFVAPRLMQYI